MLPLLLLPLVTPLLIGGVEVTGHLLGGGALGEVAHWLRLMAVFDGMALVVGWMVFEYAVEE